MIAINVTSRLVTVCVAAVCAAPLSAQDAQFDLICGYGESERVRDSKTTIHEAPPKHLQIDLIEGRWCEGTCGKSRISDVVGVNEGEVILTDKKSVGFEGTPNEFTSYEWITFNRETGLLTKRYNSESRGLGGTKTTDTNQCEEREFSGLSWSEFKSAHIKNQARFARDLNDGKPGKLVKKLAPSGTTPVAVRVQVSAKGKATSCTASAPDVPPEFEAAVCAFVMRDKVEFYPALNPEGEPVDSEYRTTMMFAGY